MVEKLKKETWGSKLGIILAVAGSAVGLGNFLRFPVQAANNGGGAFMIPYFVSLLLIGLPLMWIEWAIGRYGGVHGHTTAPGMFHRLWDNRLGKYLGVIGVFGPLVICIYYLYIESWLLGYSFYSLSGVLMNVPDKEGMAKFLSAYQGLEPNTYFSSIAPAYFFFFVTIMLNFWVIFRGVTGGIEKLCKIAMPLLFLAAIVLVVRVITLGPPYPDRPDWSIFNGFGYLWNPDFSALLNAKTWLAAAGQILFTLSVGIGVILTYASYLKRGDDIALSGLTAASTNEFAEVILGGSIIIPLAFAFFGPEGMKEVAAKWCLQPGLCNHAVHFLEDFPGGRSLPSCGFFCCFWRD